MTRVAITWAVNHLPALLPLLLGRRAKPKGAFLLWKVGERPTGVGPRFPPAAQPAPCLEAVLSGDHLYSFHGVGAAA